MKRQRRAGVIRVERSILLDLLGYKGGELLGVRDSPPFYLPGLEIAIKHKDMPVVEEGGMLPVVMPTYQLLKNGRIRRLRGKDLVLEK